MARCAAQPVPPHNFCHPDGDEDDEDDENDEDYQHEHEQGLAGIYLVKKGGIHL